MKIKDSFILREIVDTWVVIPIGERVVEFNAIISLSESGASLWKMLQEGADETELVKSLISEYDVDEVTASKDVKEFIREISNKGLLEV
jgi:hypothetical protein